MPEPSDPMLTAIAEALRAPVDLGPDLEHRVLAILAAEPRPLPRSRRVPPTLAWAAALAGIALFGAALLQVPRSDTAPPGPLPTRAIELTLATSASSGVAVVGDFNDWDPQATMLTRRGDRWSTTLSLRPGRYRYTFLVDGARWMADPNMVPSADPDFDRPTSVLTVNR